MYCTYLEFKYNVCTYVLGCISCIYCMYIYGVCFFRVLLDCSYILGYLLI